MDHDIQIKEICKREADNYNIVDLVHPEDHIFQFCINHEHFQTKDQAVRYYFSQGRESAEKLVNLLLKYCEIPIAKIELLEFASGYGAVTRHFCNTMPDTDITSCDIHEDAIDFIMNKLSTKAELSDAKPESLNLPKKYDVIFALSFFSHMPKETWGRWLMSLANYLKEDGLLIFTTHGDKSREHLGFPSIPESGFWFKPFSEQKDLNASEYGMTITTNKYVKSEITKIKNARLIFFEEGYWWKHQDVYVVRIVANE